MKLCSAPPPPFCPCFFLSPAPTVASHKFVLFADDLRRHTTCRPEGDPRSEKREATTAMLRKVFRDGSFHHAGSRTLGCGRRRGCTTAKALSTSLASASPKVAAADTPAPSLTFGIIPQPAEAREKVLDYLRREGIDTSELADVELPSSVDVMKERIDFLKTIGLLTETIDNYPLMVTCSVKKNMIPVLDYLEKLGIRAKDLPNFIEKYPMILQSSVVIDLMPVVDYLQGLDIKEKDIPSVLLRFPDVLGFRLEGTMSTSVAYLVSIGVKTRSIGRMLTEYPEIMGMRVAKMIKPTVDFLVSLGIPLNIVARLLEMRPQILGFGLNDRMRPAVDSLKKAGVQDEAIPGMITQYPDILGQTLDQKLSEKTKWLVEQVKVASCDVPRILEKLPQVLYIKEALALERIIFLTNAGFSAEDVAKMVTDCPQLLVMSIKQALEPSLNFLLQEMKRPCSEAVDFPTYFTYSLTARIQPRYMQISRKGIQCSLAWFLNCSDQKFKQRLEADYIDDEDPGPVFQMGGSLALGVDQDRSDESSIPHSEGYNSPDRHHDTDTEVQQVSYSS